MGRKSELVGVATMSVTPVVSAAAAGPVVTAGIATAISMFWISVAAGVDRMCRQLPDAFVVFSLLTTAMAAAVLTLQGSTTAITAAGFGAVSWAFPLLFVHLIAPTHLGFGDVKAAGAIGATLGLTQGGAVIACALVVAVSIAALTARRSRRSDIALGPCLVAGACVGLGLSLLSREVA